HPGRRGATVRTERGSVDHLVAGLDQRRELAVPDPGILRIVHDRHDQDAQRPRGHNFFFSACRYCPTTSPEGPSIIIWPWSIQIARSHSRSMVWVEWLTRKTVPACSRISSIFAWLRVRNAASP